MRRTGCASRCDTPHVQMQGLLACVEHDCSGQSGHRLHTSYLPGVRWNYSAFAEIRLLKGRSATRERFYEPDAFPGATPYLSFSRCWGCCPTPARPDDGT